MTKKSFLLICSIILNMGLFSISVFLLPKKGETSFSPSKPIPTPSIAVPVSPVKFFPYYLDKKSLFEVLPYQNKDTIFLGDSLTDRCAWSELFENLSLKNRGISGDNLYGVLNRLDQVTASRPQKIFVMIGINDIIAKEKLDRVFYKYNLMLSRIKESTPKTQVFIQSVLPVNNNFKPIADNANIILLNNELKILAKKFKYEYIDLYSQMAADNQLFADYTNDGIHLNGKGYLVWKQAISKYID